jgi:nicotinate-nucleotide pyrophosphorylase (carboxylating)
MIFNNIFNNNKSSKKLEEFLTSLNLTKLDINKSIALYLEEDLGFNSSSIFSDITTKYLLTKPLNAKIEIICKDETNNIILSGMCFVFRVLDMLNIKYNLISFKNDGDVIKKGDVILEIELLNTAALTAERTILNIIQQSSGVATKCYYTQNIVDACCKSKNIDQIKILDTRKTMLGSRILQKYSVFVSGAKNHRFGLYDKILIKDNHIDALGGMQNLIEFIKQNKIKIPIEIECQTEAQVKLVVENQDFFETIMLDNFSPEDVKSLAKLIKQNTKLFVEVSGGINAQNISDYCLDGVNFISIGELTHSVKSIDFSLNLYYS